MQPPYGRNSLISEEMQNMKWSEIYVNNFCPPDTLFLNTTQYKWCLLEILFELSISLNTSAANQNCILL